MYTKELNERWVKQMASVVRQRTGVNIENLLRDGPGWVLLNLCAKTDLLPAAFADARIARWPSTMYVGGRIKGGGATLSRASKPGSLHSLGCEARIGASAMGLFSSSEATRLKARLLKNSSSKL